MMCNSLSGWTEFCTQLHPKRKSRSQRLSLTPALSTRIWLRGLDLNQRPSGYEPDELPDCSTPRLHYSGCGPVRPTNRICSRALILKRVRDEIGFGGPTFRSDAGCRLRMAFRP